MEKLIQFYMSCGYDHASAVEEVETALRYHTTGVDAVSREYAIEMMLEDIEND